MAKTHARGACPTCRQAERRDDIKEVLQHWGYARTVDMSVAEKEDKYLEVRGCRVVCL